jgi:hypothetical protein
MNSGTSSRIVIDIETDLKNRLHAHVALEGRTLKEWFVERAKEYILHRDEAASGRSVRGSAARGKRKSNQREEQQ